MDDERLPARTFAQRVGDALRAAAPEANSDGWLRRIEHEVGARKGTGDNWYYGSNAPQAETLLELLLHPETGPHMCREFLEPRGLTIAAPDGNGHESAAFQRIVKIVHEFDSDDPTNLRAVP